MDVRKAKANARRLKATVQRVEQQPYGFASGRRLPRAIGGAADLWCQLSGTLGAATGTWPSITATTTTADVYRGTPTGLSLVASGATIYNWRNVSWSAAKTCYLVPSADGYAIVDQDC
jgi:hypothetical protein